MLLARVNPEKSGKVYLITQTFCGFCGLYSLLVVGFSLFSVLKNGDTIGNKGYYIIRLFFRVFCGLKCFTGLGSSVFFRCFFCVK